MKRTVALLLGLCLLFCMTAGCSGSTIEAYDNAGDAPTSAGETAAATPTPTAAITIGAGGTGYETYDPDTVVATVNGEDVTWMEYYYWLYYYVQYVQQLAGQYNASLTSWDANELSSSDTNAQVVISNAQRNVILEHAVATETAKLGLTLDEDDRAEIQSLYETNADSVTGDGDGTCTGEETAAFEEYLTQQNVDREFFDYLNEIDLLQDKAFAAQYGEDGADYPDEDARTYAEDNGLMAAKHILLLTVDADTREPLEDEAVIAEKKATAENLLSQLQAVEGDREALVALFDELTEEYTEDTGYASYPDGYVFSEGQMVSEFEDAVKELGEYEMSGIVESSYGYHIILRIPVDPDAVIGTTSGGKDVTLRYQAAAQQFSAQLSAWTDGAEVTWAEGFETPDMAAIFG